MSGFAAVGQAIEDARDGIDLWYAFIIGLPALAGVFATLVVTIKGQRKAEATRDELIQKADITIGQVVNSHTLNLRDEITEGFREIRSDIRQMRKELDNERSERVEEVRSLRREF